MKATCKAPDRLTPCHECGRRLPAERPMFHPHVYCMLYKAGVRDPETYMRATMPLLAEHFGVPTGEAE